MKLFIISMLIVFNTSAHETNIVVPLMTAHINDTGFNNNNRGLGIEIQLKQMVYSIVAIDRNSLNDSSVYFSTMYKKTISRNLNLFAGITLASGYAESVRYIPSISAQYYNLRISTTYPSSKLLCKEENVTDTINGEVVNSCSDVINIQYIQKF